MSQVGGVRSARVWVEKKIYFIKIFNLLRFRQRSQYQHCTSFHSQVICENPNMFWVCLQSVRPVSSTKTDKLSRLAPGVEWSGAVCTYLGMYQISYEGNKIWEFCLKKISSHCIEGNTSSRFWGAEQTKF